MTQFVFLSSMYWLNFAILTGFGCVDFFPVMYFYLFLALFVFPIGHSFYSLAFNDKFKFEQTFAGILKILLAIPIIAVTNFLFGINRVNNLALLFLSYACIVFFKRKFLRQNVSFSKLLSAIREKGAARLEANHIFAIIFSAFFTIVSINSFQIYNFFPDHVTVRSHPADASCYYAVISSLAKHAGSFIHGFEMSIISGVDRSAFPFLSEIFESVFIRFTGADIILFHSVIFSIFLILLLFCISFVPIFKKESLSIAESNNPWNQILFGLVVFLIFSYPRPDCSLLVHSIVAWRGYLSWTYVLTAMMIYFSANALLREEIDLRPHIVIALFLCFIGLLLHVINSGIFILAFLIYLFYNRLSRVYKPYFALVWAFAIMGAIILLATIFKNHAFVFDELKISIHGFNANKNAFLPYFDDLPFLRQIYHFISAFVLSNSVMANIMGSAYAVFCFIGYFLIIPVCCFVFSKNRLKFYFANIILGIYMVLLLINYFISNRPSIVAMYMPWQMLVAMSLMAIEIILAADYFHFQKAGSLLKIVVISSLAIIVLYFNYLAFGVRYGKLDIDRNLYDVIEYVKRNTSSDSVVLHNLKSSEHYAYFSGFALRNTVMEYSAYAYAHYSGWNGRAADIAGFYEGEDADIRSAILNKYGVTHILSSPDCPLNLEGRHFEPVFSNSEYVLYGYHKGE